MSAEVVDVVIPGEATDPLSAAELCGLLERVAGWFEIDFAHPHTFIGICRTGGGCDHPGIAAVDASGYTDYLILISGETGESFAPAWDDPGGGETPARLLVGPGGWGHGGDPHGKIAYHCVPNHEEAVAAAAAKILIDSGIARR